MNLKKRIERVIGIFEKLFMAVAMISVFIMMISISADAMSRYLFGSPITGQYEFTQYYLLVILIFMAFSRTYIIGGHIRIRILDPILQKIPFDFSERLNAILAALAFGVLTYVSAMEAVGKFVNQDKLFGAIQFPIYWSYVWVPLGCGLMTLRLAYDIIYPMNRLAAGEGGEL